VKVWHPTQLIEIERAHGQNLGKVTHDRPVQMQARFRLMLMQ